MKQLKQLKIRSQKKNVLVPFTSEIIDMYQNLMSMTKIAEIYGVHWSSVRNLLIKNKIPIKSVKSSCYRIDENFFEVIDSEEKAYILGFIYADGCIVESTGTTKYLTITCAEQDCSHLEKMRNIFAPNYRIFTSTHNQKINPNSQLTYVLSIGSKLLCDNLAKHGCHPRKSLTLEFPTTIPEHLIHHFIRGYFDGDGCISVVKGTTRKKFTICGSYNFLKVLKQLFISKLNTNDTKILFRKDDKINDIWFAANKDILSIREFLYKDATIYLQRKYDKFYS